MPEIVVEADRITPTTGTFIIDREIIEKLPSRDGSVDELIGIAPGVQFGEDYLNSATGGEIEPPPVSISGSRFYDNNYTIDGVSNNSPLDPASDAISDANKLPGHPQIQFLSPDIIESITVYNSNIPAEFGGFTGGVVDTRTLNPTAEPWGKVSYRTTRDSWTKFHIDPLLKDDFYNSNNASNQPRFSKHHYGLTLNIPISDDTGMVTSYQQLRSQIPLQHLGNSQTQVRKQENFFLKLEHLTDSGRLAFTVLYAPTMSSYFMTDVKDSEYTLESENLSLALQMDKEFSLAELGLTFGYVSQNIDRQAALHRYNWNPETPSIDWSSGREGGLGDLDTSHDTASLKADVKFKHFQLGQTDHAVKLGAETAFSKQSYHRPATSYLYYSPSLEAVSCAADDPACIDGEQYLTRRTVYNKADSDVEVFDFSAYIQDAIIWKRFELFPGLRFSFDDFTDNLNLAPRLSASLDLFGNRNTILFAGRNRYYSGTLLTQALFKSIVTENQVRTTAGNEDSDWSSSTNFLYLVAETETPYTDESTLGIIQRLFGGELKLQYIKKSSKDEYARSRITNPDTGSTYFYILNNLGRSEHESFQISWQRTWENLFVEINSTWQDTTTTNTDYDTTMSEDDYLETIWYQGEELLVYEIPRLDFNRPVVANLICSFKLPYEITFTNVIKYRGPYWRLSRTSERRPSILYPEQSPDPYVYEKRKTKNTFTVDWHINWQLPKVAHYTPALTLDIFNVTNQRTNFSYQTGAYGYEYELGRQFWAGLEINF